MRVMYEKNCVCVSSCVCECTHIWAFKKIKQLSCICDSTRTSYLCYTMFLLMFIYVIECRYSHQFLLGYYLPSYNYITMPLQCRWVLRLHQICWFLQIYCFYPYMHFLVWQAQETPKSFYLGMNSEPYSSASLSFWDNAFNFPPKKWSDLQAHQYSTSLLIPVF